MSATTTTPDLDTSIVRAVFEGNLSETVKLLVSNPSLVNKMFDFSILPINKCEKTTGTLMHLLCRDSFCGHSYSDVAKENILPIADFLIHKRANIHICDSRGYSVLYSAIVSNNGLMVKFLLENGANLEDPRGGHTPLTFACAKHHIGPLRILLDKKANPNHLFDGKFSGLYFACTKNTSFQVEMVTLLLDSGANPSLGVSPLFAEQPYCESIKCESVELMLKHKNKLEINQMYNGISSLFSLINSRNTSVLRILLNTPGIDTACKNADGKTPAQVVSALVKKIEVPIPLENMSAQEFEEWANLRDYRSIKGQFDEWTAILHLCLQ